MSLDDLIDNTDVSSTDDEESDDENDSSPHRDGYDEDSTSALDRDDIVENSPMTFYASGDADLGANPMERKGAMSNHTTAELVDQTSGTITCEEDHVKFHAPMFPIVTANPQYEQGNMYQLKHETDNVPGSWDGRVVTCVGTISTQLSKINKEVIMFDAGSPSKKHVMEKLEDRFGQDIDGEMAVWISFFGDAMFMRDMAQANEEYKEGDKLSIDKIGKRVMNKEMLRVEVNRRDDPDRVV